VAPKALACGNAVPTARFELRQQGLPCGELDGTDSQDAAASNVFQAGINETASLERPATAPAQPVDTGSACSSDQEEMI